MLDTQIEAFTERLGIVFRKCLPRLAPDARDELAAVMAPQSLSAIAGVLVAWVVGHFFGIGEAVDIVVGVVGVLSIGIAVFSGLDELYEFARLTYAGSSDHDLDRPADHLAKAITILGVEAVIAVLLRGLPRAKRVPVGPEPPRGPGFRYQPRTVGTPALPRGEGATDAWGDLEFSTRGTPEEQLEVELHEKVHQFITPKAYLLRRFRVENGMGSYIHSSLRRYIEEALAETVALVRVRGLTGFVGLRFPTRTGYVYWMRTGADPANFPGFGGKGIVPEGAALIATGTLQGLAYRLWFKVGSPSASEGPEPIIAPSLAPGPRRLSTWFSRH